MGEKVLELKSVLRNSTFIYDEGLEVRNKCFMSKLLTF